MQVISITLSWGNLFDSLQKLSLNWQSGVRSNVRFNRKLKGGLPKWRAAFFVYAWGQSVSSGTLSPA